MPPPDFNPRSPHGERLLSVRATPSRVIFQSTLSSRRATSTRLLISEYCVFQSTLSSRRATTDVSIFPPLSRFQSTLSSRRATHVAFSFLILKNISIHALLTESDIGGKVSGAFSGLFQSTLSSRRATR